MNKVPGCPDWRKSVCTLCGKPFHRKSECLLETDEEEKEYKPYHVRCYVYAYRHTD